MILRRAEDGFTLIEMLVVLAVLGLLGGLVLARGPQRSAALEMRQASGLVAGAFRVARARAIATNHAVPVRFDPASGTLQVGAEAPLALPRRVTLAAPAPPILFRPDGSSSGGSVQLVGEGRRARVDVNWLTGRVAVGDAG